MSLDGWFVAGSVASSQTNEACAASSQWDLVVHRFVPIHLLSLSLASTYRFPLCSCPSCLHALSSSSFTSFARAPVRAVDTRVCFLERIWLRCPRLVTMRFGLSAVPLHLVPTTYLFVFLALSFLLFLHHLRAHVRIGALEVNCPASLGEACACKPLESEGSFGLLK